MNKFLAVLLFAVLATALAQDVIKHYGKYGGQGVSSRYFQKAQNLGYGGGYGGYGGGYGGYGGGYGGYGGGYGGYGGGYGGYGGGYGGYGAGLGGYAGGLGGYGGYY